MLYFIYIYPPNEGNRELCHLSRVKILNMVAELLAVNVPATVGMIGAVLLTLSLVAALVLNCADKRRKSPGTANGSVAATPAAKAEIVDTRPGHCSILFGTQTGTAERFAKSLKSQLESKYGASTVFDVIDVENYSSEKLATEKLIFFLMATYGDGEPTDNAADFYNWLLEQAKESSMEAPLCEVGIENLKKEYFKSTLAPLNPLISKFIS